MKRGRNSGGNKIQNMRVRNHKLLRKMRRRIRSMIKLHKKSKGKRESERV